MSFSHSYSQKKRPRSETSEFFRRTPVSPGTFRPPSPAFPTASPEANVHRVLYPDNRQPYTPAATGLSNHHANSSVRIGRASINTGPTIHEETEEEVHARENNDALNEIIMALDMQKHGTVGCAYYTAREQTLYLMEDSRMGGIEVVETLKLAIVPTIILISTKADEALEKLLTDEAKTDEDGDGVFGRHLLYSRQTSEFSFDSAVNRLMNLPVLKNRVVATQFSKQNNINETNDMDREDGPSTECYPEAREILLAGMIDLKSRCTISCAGAVLAYIRRNQVTNPDAQSQHDTFRIKVLEMFSLADTVFVNVDTLASLQIIQSECHPNPLSQGPIPSADGSKESLSVYGLFLPLANTPQGKSRLRRMFLRPTMNLAIIEQRHAAIATLLKPDNVAILDSLSKSLNQIKNIRSVTLHLQKGVSDSAKRGAVKRGVWGSLQKFTYHTLRIVEALQQLCNGYALQIVHQTLETLDRVRLQEVGTLITDIVDFEKSAESHRTAVLPRVDSELDTMKQTYDGMDSLLTQVATNLSESVPDWASQYIENCIFFPQLGFLTVVPLDSDTGLGKYTGEGMDEESWQMMFSTDELGYFKNPRMLEMDTYFGDMYSMICDKEIEIIHNLAVRILEYEDMLVAASDICGDLDCLVALAKGAQRYNLVPPSMTAANVICIDNGRHLLQEFSVRSFVANSTYLVGGPGTCEEDTDDSDFDKETNPHPSTLLMTGPNYSGKSVYLKQVAIIVYMAHIGSYVPADSAVIGITDKIFTRIATRESVSQTQSAFMIDLQQIALATTLATRRSLILIDEFGKGTSSIDGAGLLSGVVEHFLSLGHERPKVIATTHFHEIFENGFLRAHYALTFGHMEIRIDKDAEEIEDQITYLYTYTAGKSVSSFGTCCAAINGIDPEVVERADDLILLSARGEDLVAACAKLSGEDARAYEDAEYLGREFLATNFPKDLDSTSGIGATRDLLSTVLKVNDLPPTDPNI